MPDQSAAPATPERRRRADAHRNEAALLSAAGRVFAARGINAPIRAIATEAGMGVGTIYRHFPSRRELVAAVYRHQVDELVALGTRVDGDSSTADSVDLAVWVDSFVTFLATKHGLAEISRTDGSGEELHDSFLGPLLPVVDALLDLAHHDGRIARRPDAYQFMRSIGNLCVGAAEDPRYDAREAVATFLGGLAAR